LLTPPRVDLHAACFNSQEVIKVTLQPNNGRGFEDERPPWTELAEPGIAQQSSQAHGLVFLALSLVVIGSSVAYMRRSHTAALQKTHRAQQIKLLTAEEGLEQEATKAVANVESAMVQAQQGAQVPFNHEQEKIPDMVARIRMCLEAQRLAPQDMRALEILEVSQQSLGSKV
jgi:hypothetical protein